MSSQNSQPLSLQQATASLAEMNSWLLESLRMLDHLLKVLQSELKQSQKPSDIIPFVQPILKRVFPFNAMAFYTVSPNSPDFTLIEVDPMSEQDFIQKEVNAYIDEGTFGWALDQNHPVIVPAFNANRTLLFHVLATRSSIIGMFVGVINELNPFIPDTVQKLLSIIMLNCANIMESTTLQNELKDYNKNLEKIIAERTQELRRSKEEEKAANRAKSLFLANMSHEIRTPLSSIIGFTELLEKTSLNDKQREYANALKISSQALMALINDILDFSKIEAGKMDIIDSEFDLKKIMEETLSLFRLKTTQKSVALELKFDDRITTMIRCDPNRLRQILINLIGNAEKFTDQGSICVTVTMVSETDQTCWLGFSVQDTGIGISAESLGKIFSTFTQADFSSTRRFGGTGLGLSISNKLVQLMGGEKIEVQSELGKGSTFSFILPAHKGEPRCVSPHPETVASQSQTVITGRHYRVLIVDDAPFNIKLAKEILAAAGHDSVGADNGEIALDILKKENFDAILMDMQMPVMDGLEATRRIRKSGIKTPVIAVTASALEGDREKCLRAGMNDYITKPIDITSVVRIIENACESNNETSINDKASKNALSWNNPDLYPVNLNSALTRLSGNRKLFKELMQCLIEQSAEFLNNLRHSIDDKQGDAVAKEAHKIKGAVAALDANALKERLIQMEKFGKESDFIRAKETLNEIEAEFDELKSYYNMFEI